MLLNAEFGLALCPNSDVCSCVSFHTPIFFMHTLNFPNFVSMNKGSHVALKPEVENDVSRWRINHCVKGRADICHFVWPTRYPLSIIMLALMGALLRPNPTQYPHPLALPLVPTPSFGACPLRAGCPISFWDGGGNAEPVFRCRRAEW